jgi:hypothetical protein
MYISGPVFRRPDDTIIEEAAEKEKGWGEFTQKTNVSRETKSVCTAQSRKTA